MPASVDTQITDGISQTGTLVTGLGPAIATVNAYMGQSQSMSVLFANSINQQQQQGIVSLSVTAQNLKKLFTSEPNHNAHLMLKIAGQVKNSSDLEKECEELKSQLKKHASKIDNLKKGVFSDDDLDTSGG